jgi:DNA adenine methylase
MNTFFDEHEIEGEGIKAFMGRIGGKRLLKKRIVDNIFPDDYEDMIYVEPFVGAGHIYFYKNPSVKEVINDLDKDIIDLLKGMKKFNGERISNSINGSYTKQEYKDIIAAHPSSPYGKFIQLLLRYKLSFYNRGKSFNPPIDGYLNTNYKNNYNERMKHTSIYNKDFKTLIKKYDSGNTLFYLDPPYENSDKLYTHDTLPIKDVYDAVKNIKGLFIISYNDSKEAKELFKNYNIIKIKTKYGKGTEGGQRHIKTELIITNY